MPDLIPALLLFLLPLAYSPGPGNLFFAALGAQGGVRAAAGALLGYHLATWIVTLGIGFGLAELTGGNGRIGNALRYAGAGYVVWLGARLTRAGALGKGPGQVRTATVRDGAMLLLLNPKAYVIIGLMFSGFLANGAGEVVLIATIFTLNNLVAFLIWTLAGDGLTRAFRSDTAGARLNVGLGAMLIGVGIWMGWP
ncbi:LysE family translocator [Flavimaricola marinus]|uniref:Cysteine/O-acetylserine efflux protein n=1 Tax=Flavimaricola marinus TaxID=1819565 RepID=A0A238LIH7_9RHOB|nr:LysE family transporter [Flavimaricola marinus]SMY09527.1 Cysteine/O-acetylserine efflux protein [Flavimaricola marinus]